MGKHLGKYKAHYICVFLSWSWSYILAYVLRMKLGLHFPLWKNEISQKLCREVSFQINWFRKDTALDASQFAFEGTVPVPWSCAFCSQHSSVADDVSSATRSQERADFGKAAHGEYDFPVVYVCGQIKWF